METLGTSTKAIQPHPVRTEGFATLQETLIGREFWQERLDCAERFVWLVGAVGSTGALIWTVGVFINRAHP